MSSKKTLEIGIICGGRSSQNTFNNFVTMYQYAKENGYIDINVNFIEPELDKYKEVIEQIREYIKENCLFQFKHDSEYFFLGISDEEPKKDLLQILDKVKNV